MPSLPLSGFHQTAVRPLGVSRVPECWVGLSDMIASVILFSGVGYGADERKANGVKGAQSLAHFHDFWQAIEAIDETPVIHLTVF